MKNGKKGMILYFDELRILSQLPDDEFGKLIKAVAIFGETMVEVELPEKLYIPYKMIISHVERDIKKYAETSEKRSEAAKKSYEKKRENNNSCNNTEGEQEKNNSCSDAENKQGNKSVCDNEEKKPKRKKDSTSGCTETRKVKESTRKKSDNKENNFSETDTESKPIKYKYREVDIPVPSEQVSDEFMDEICKIMNPECPETAQGESIKKPREAEASVCMADDGEFTSDSEHNKEILKSYINNKRNQNQNSENRPIKP